jgi:hypothetical protein
VVLEAIGVKLIPYLTLRRLALRLEFIKKNTTAPGSGLNDMMVIAPQKGEISYLRGYFSDNFIVTVIACNARGKILWKNPEKRGAGQAQPALHPFFRCLQSQNDHCASRNNGSTFLRAIKSK